MSIKNSITGLEYFEKERGIFSKYLAKQSIISRETFGEANEDMDEVLNQEMRLLIYKSKVILHIFLSYRVRISLK